MGSADAMNIRIEKAAFLYGTLCATLQRGGFT